MTIVETLVWIAIFTSAMIAVSSSVLYFYRTSNYAIQQASAVASAQRGIDAMIRTMREASYASNGAYPIVSIGSNDVRFYAEIDGDVGIEQLHYYISNNALMKGVIDPSGDPAVYTGSEVLSTVSNDLRNTQLGVALFTYYNKTGGQITDFTKIGDVRFVTANLQVDVDPNRTPTPLGLKSSAALRNLIGK